jgi:hypothetical protein
MKSFFLLTLLSLLALTACERVDERMPITQSREISPLAKPAQLDIPSSTRFYDDKDEGQPQQNPLVWITPAEWKEKPASQMRLINLSFGPQSEAECYLTAIPGEAGGIAANLNRWRKQMGQPDLSDSEIATLPKRSLMGGEAIQLSVDGAFQGMGDAASAKRNYRLVGLLLPNPELTLFVKMTGPIELLEQNRAQFDAFCNSINFRGKTQATPFH